MDEVYREMIQEQVSKKGFALRNIYHPIYIEKTKFRRTEDFNNKEDERENERDGIIKMFSKNSRSH